MRSPVRIWWNWQTRYFEVVVGQPVQVQVLLCAPCFLRKAVKLNYPFYRLAYRVNGQCRMRPFRTYSEVKREWDKLVKELARGSQVAVLSAAQACDALAALERLQGFYQSTGRRVSLLGGISEYREAVSKLLGRTLGQAVDGYPNRPDSMWRVRGQL